MQGEGKGGANAPPPTMRQARYISGASCGGDVKRGFGGFVLVGWLEYLDHLRSFKII